MTEFFNDGGWTMFPTALFGVLTVVASLVLAVRPERRFVPLVLSLSALTMMTGFLGTMIGLTGVVKATTNAAPADAASIISACATQALNSLMLASLLVVVAFLGVVSSALRVATTRPAAAS
jgi:hypothetical protein